MRVSLQRILFVLQLAVLTGATVFLTGCQTAEPQFQDAPSGMTSQDADTSAEELSSAVKAAPNSTIPPDQNPPAPQKADTDVFRVGETVNVTFSGMSPQDLPKPHEERIKDDGTITLYLVGTVKAAGKNPGDLQRELQKAYEKYYKNIVVTVTGISRAFYVGGEVKRPNAYPYIGAPTVTKAIQTAGGFTDFANRKNIQVIRADGTTETVNYNDATEEPDKDPPIFPGDRIEVKRRWL